MAASREKARAFIDYVRSKKGGCGGLPKGDTKVLEEQMPHVIEIIENLRRDLAAATKTYVILVGSIIKVSEYVASC